MGEVGVLDKLNIVRTNGTRFNELAFVFPTQHTQIIVTHSNNK